MSITDLTNTLWRFKANLSVPSGILPEPSYPSSAQTTSSSAKFNILPSDITFYGYKSRANEAVSYQFRGSNSSSLTINVCGNTYTKSASNKSSVPDLIRTMGNAEFVVEILGGDDATNAKLINWVVSNATQVIMVKYVTPCGTTPDSVSDVTLLTNEMLPQLSAIGYKFIDWYYDSGYEEKANAGDILQSSITLYAKWEIVPRSKISLQQFSIAGKANIQLKAKAQGYLTSDLSESVEYTSEPVGSANKVIFINTELVPSYFTDNTYLSYSTDNGLTWTKVSDSFSDILSVSKIKFRLKTSGEDYGDQYYIKYSCSDPAFSLESDFSDVNITTNEFILTGTMQISIEVYD